MHKQENEFLLVAFQHRITDELVRNLLVGAFEGGSNYWYLIEKYEYGNVSPHEFREGGKYYDPEYKMMDHYLLPFVPGCSLVISNRMAEEGDNVEKYILNRQSIQSGLEIMRDKFPRHWNDLVTENDDCETADVFLQCALMGNVIYG